MTAPRLLRQAVEEARAAVAKSLPEQYAWNRSMLLAMCAVTSVETHCRLSLAGRRPRVEYRLSLLLIVQHFWVSCDGYVIDGTAKQLDGPLVYLSRNREPKFFHYEAERSFARTETVARFLRKLGWSGPAASLLVQEKAT